MKKITILLLLILFNMSSSFGQDLEGQIGTGTDTNVDLPITTDEAINYSQQIYLASEVQAAIGNKTSITSIKFHINISGSSRVLRSIRDWKIYMANTDKSDFSGVNDWIAPNSIEKVFDGQIVFQNPTNDWFELVFDTPFEWDGTSNIVVAVHKNTGGPSRQGTFRKMDTPTARGLLYKHFRTHFDFSSPSSAESIVNFVPQIVLKGETPSGEVTPLSCESPVDIEVSNVLSTSAKFNFNIVDNNQVLGVEYHLSSIDTPPADNAGFFEIINNPNRELLLTDLNVNERYFIWFRTKCSEGVYSAWTDSYTFATLDDGQISAGLEVMYSLPIKTSDNYSYSQQIYLANEISQAIGDNHYVTKIKFNYKNIGSSEYNSDLKIYVGNTNKANFGGFESQNWVANASMQEVFNGTISFLSSTEDWIEIELDDPFLWDGASNIVIGVYAENQNPTSNISFKNFKTAENRGMLYWTPNGMSLVELPNADQRVNNVPQIIFVSEEIPSCIPPVTTNYSNLKMSSVKISWNNPLLNSLGVEYYYSITDTAPIESTEVSGTVNASINEVDIINLTEDTEYYIWLRTICSATEKSEWSRLPLKFKTLLKGQIGHGESVSTFLPIVPNYTSSYSQQIYLKDEIYSAIGDERYIKKIKFYYNGEVDVESIKDWKIFIGNTEVNNFAETDITNVVPVPVNSLFQVFDGVVPLANPFDGWVEIELHNPFLWDGESNIVIGVNEYSPSVVWGGPTFKVSNTDFYRGLSYTDFMGNINLDELPNQKQVYKYVPQIILVSESAPSCLMPLNINITDVSLYSATVNWASVAGANVLNYEYEVRISGEEASGEEGRIKFGTLENNIYTVLLNELEHSTEYSVYMRSKCTDTDFSEWTTVVSFKTDCYLPEFTIADQSVCGQGKVTLEANIIGEFNGEMGYRWYDSETSSVPLTYENTFETPLLTETTTYWVDMYIGPFYSMKCISPRKAVVVTVNPAPVLELSNTDFEICSGQISYLVFVTEGASDYNNYSWTPTEGVIGDHLTGWAFNPTKTKEYVLTATQGDEASCIAVKKVNVKVNHKDEFTLITEENDIVVCSENVVKLGVEDEAILEAVIGNGTDLLGFMNTNTAFNNAGHSGKSQLIYTATDLINEGYSAGYIRSISFNISSLGSSATNDDYVVRIATTDLAEFGDNNFITEGFTTVYGPSTYTHTNSGWQEIEFATPFLWDGTSNLIVEISHKGANLTENAITYYTETDTNTLIYSSDNEVRGILSNRRYNIKFKRGFVFQANWFPATNLYLDEATTIPYSEGENSSMVFYKATEEGNSEVKLAVSPSSNCPVIIDYNIITVVNTAASIVVEENQSFCGETKVSDLIVAVQEGAIVNWYADEFAIEPLNNDDILVTNNYFVSQKIGECESVRKLVSVIINELPQTPIGDAIQELEEGALVKDIVTDQTNVIWFSTEEDATNGENQLSNDEVIVAGTYYGVVKSAAGCVSSPIIVSVNIKLGVNDFDLTKLSYYPNPVKDVLTITYRDIIDSVEVYSLSGQRILFVKSASNEVVVDMSQFMSSTYIIKISSGGTSQNIKVVKK